MDSSLEQIGWLVASGLALSFMTHVVLRPDAYKRRVEGAAFADLVAELGRDRAMAQRLVEDELGRGANTPEQAIRSARARLRRDRRR